MPTLMERQLDPCWQRTIPFPVSTFVMNVIGVMCRFSEMLVENLMVEEEIRQIFTKLQRHWEVESFSTFALPFALDYLSVTGAIVS